MKTTKEQKQTKVKSAMKPSKKPARKKAETTASTPEADKLVNEALENLSPEEAAVRKQQIQNARARAEAGDKLGLKERIKAGLISAREALQQMEKKGKYAQQSSTYAWIRRRAEAQK